MILKVFSNLNDSMILFYDSMLELEAGFCVSEEKREILHNMVSLLDYVTVP